MGKPTEAPVQRGEDELREPAHRCPEPGCGVVKASKYALKKHQRRHHEKKED